MKQRILLEIVNFINNISKDSINKNEDFINNVIESTNFNNLQYMEKAHGFNEATSHSLFFRKGKSNQWQSVLSIDQIKLIEKELKGPMKSLGYLK